MLFANVCLPSVAGHIIWLFLLLFPIALIEGIILAIRFRLNCVEAFQLCFLANVKSTVIGLPIGYLMAFLGVIPAGILLSFCRRI